MVALWEKTVNSEFKRTMPLRQLEKNWLQLNMHNDKNVGQKNENLSCWQKGKKGLLFNALTRLSLSSKVIKATEYLWDTGASKKHHYGIWHHFIRISFWITKQVLQAHRIDLKLHPIHRPMGSSTKLHTHFKDASKLKEFQTWDEGS